MQRLETFPPASELDVGHRKTVRPEEIRCCGASVTKQVRRETNGTDPQFLTGGFEPLPETPCREGEQLFVPTCGGVNNSDYVIKMINIFFGALRRAWRSSPMLLLTGTKGTPTAIG
jgi:hypothetical protein